MVVFICNLVLFRYEHWYGGQLHHWHHARHLPELDEAILAIFAYAALLFHHIQYEISPLGSILGEIQVAERIWASNQVFYLLSPVQGHGVALAPAIRWWLDPWQKSFGQGPQRLPIRYVGYSDPERQGPVVCVVNKKVVNKNKVSYPYPFTTKDSVGVSNRLIEFADDQAYSLKSLVWFFNGGTWCVPDGSLSILVNKIHVNKIHTKNILFNKIYILCQSLVRGAKIHTRQNTY